MEREENDLLHNELFGDYYHKNRQVGAHDAGVYHRVSEESPVAVPFVVVEEGGGKFRLRKLLDLYLLFGGDLFGVGGYLSAGTEGGLHRLVLSEEDLRARGEWRRRDAQSEGQG